MTFVCNKAAMKLAFGWDNGLARREEKLQGKLASLPVCAMWSGNAAYQVK
jgi:hypothetical protein